MKITYGKIARRSKKVPYTHLSLPVPLHKLQLCQNQYISCVICTEHGERGGVRKENGKQNMSSHSHTRTHKHSSSQNRKKWFFNLWSLTRWFRVYIHTALWFLHFGSFLILYVGQRVYVNSVSGIKPGQTFNWRRIHESKKRPSHGEASKQRTQKRTVGRNTNWAAVEEAYLYGNKKSNKRFGMQMSEIYYFST